MILDAASMNKARMLQALEAGFPLTFEYVGSVAGACKVVDKMAEYLLLWGSVVKDDKGQIVVSIWPCSKTEH